jgi:hypothetical protein
MLAAIRSEYAEHSGNRERIGGAQESGRAVWYLNAILARGELSSHRAAQG